MVVLVLMGVCGCGKTTVAKELAIRLQCPFKDADDFHTEENKKKMNSGIALTDQLDRGFTNWCGDLLRSETKLQGHSIIRLWISYHFTHQ
ncbi:gluconokinase [Elysia marginata]|uniref:gluconokinase n=1 Tax=Elysia marginata TaxID=1093978 RepID=A0AAV4JEE1_9GAST|nr:gluconokinase [Elysia marginata]